MSLAGDGGWMVWNEIYVNWSVEAMVRLLVRGCC